MKVIKDLRKQIIRNLKRMMWPHLWPSGYVDSTEADKSLRVFVFTEVKESRLRKISKNMFSEELNAIMGFYKDGVIPDAYAGGMATTSFESICIEDLVVLEQWMMKNFYKEVDKVKQSRKIKA